MAVVEALLSGALVLSPLAFGTVHYAALAAMAAVAAAAAVVAATARPRATPWPVWFALATAAWVGAQAIPLPPSVLRVLSPRAAELVSSVGGGWHALSLDPSATAREFARLFAFAAAFFAAARLATDGNAARRLCKVVAAMVVVECAVAAVHKIFGNNDHIYGIVTTSTSTLVLGTLGNGNHLSAYLTLGIPLVAAAAERSNGAAARRFWWATAAVATAVVVLTVERSGLIGLLGAAATWLVLSRGRIKRTRLLAAIGATFGAAILLTLFLSPWRAARFASLLHPTELLGEEKVMVWRAVPGLVRDFWLTGIGRGAFEEIFPSYQRHDWAMSYSHVENTALQLPVDLGMIVGAAVAAAWVTALVRAVRRTAASGEAAARLHERAAIAGLVGVTLHDLGDFSLDAAGAVGLTAAILWGVITPAVRLRSTRSIALAPPTFAALGLAALGALWIGWRGDLRRDVAAVEEATRNPADDPAPLIDGATARHPAEPWFPFMAGVNDVRHHRPARALSHLNRTLLLNPRAWRPHQVVAEALLQLNRRSQALLEFRLAYVASGYSDRVLSALIELRDLHFDSGLSAFAGDDREVLAHLADYLARLRREEDAAAVARRLAELAPTDERAHRILARTALARGRFAEVLADAVQLPADDEEAALLRARALTGLKRDDEAANLLEQTFARSRSPAIAFEVAERALSRHHHEVALATLAAVSPKGLDPQQLGRYYFLRGHALEAAGHTRDALLELSNAARIDPSEANRLELGAAYERAGMMRDALLEYRTLVRSTNPPSREAAQRMARIEATLGGAINIKGGGDLDEEQTLFGGKPGEDVEGATP